MSGISTIPGSVHSLRKLEKSLSSSLWRCSLGIETGPEPAVPLVSPFLVLRGRFANPPPLDGIDLGGGGGP